MKRITSLAGLSLLTGCTIVVAPEPKLMVDLSHMPVCRQPETSQPPATEDPVMRALQEMAMVEGARGKLIACSQVYDDYVCEPKDFPKLENQPLKITVTGSRALLMFPEEFSMKDPSRMEKADQSVWMKKLGNSLGLQTDALKPRYDFSIRMAGREIRITVTHLIGELS